MTVYSCGLGPRSLGRLLDAQTRRALSPARFPRLLAVFDRGDTPPPAGGRMAVRPPSRRPPRPRPHSAAVGVLPPLKMVTTGGYKPMRRTRRNNVKSGTPAVGPEVRSIAARCTRADKSNNRRNPGGRCCRRRLQPARPAILITGPQCGSGMALRRRLKPAPTLRGYFA
jgi:hypothetical protein